MALSKSSSVASTRHQTLTYFRSRNGKSSAPTARPASISPPPKLDPEVPWRPFTAATSQVDAFVKARERAMLYKSTGYSLRTSAVAQGQTDAEPTLRQGISSASGSLPIALRYTYMAPKCSLYLSFLRTLIYGT